MSERAKAWRIVAIDGASHVLMVSKPDAVADLIVEASGASRS
jgi:pimeloyl-ACP methyl ester carboxylesterase